MMNARTIASILGGDVTGRDTVNCPGPGHSKFDRSLSIKLDSRAAGGFVVFSHSGDDPMECRDYVRERLGLAKWQRGDGRRSTLGARTSGPDPRKGENKAAALRIWMQGVHPSESIVEHYLREHRGLELSDDIAGNVIRYHGSLYFDGETRLPGMVCLMRDIVTNDPCGIHRTFLDRRDAHKVDRKMLGIAKRAAIKLDQPGDNLTIGEGVETALSGRAAGFGPVWALGSSGAVRSFPVVRGTSEITILQENDPTSQRDARICAERYLSAGKPVNIIKSRVGNDMNDAWKAAQ